MINIIGDTYKELSIIQSAIETGVVDDKTISAFDVTYKLSSGNLILTDKYGNIVGEESKEEA